MAKARAFRFQDPGEGIREAEVVEIRASPGDTVSEGQVVLLVETDKAEFEVSAPFSGTVEEVRVSEGDMIRVGDTLLTIAAEGDADEAEGGTRGERRERREAGSGRERAPAESEAGAREAERRERTAREERRGRGEGPVPASPATRRVARELGVDLREVSPSGDGGRVLTDDVRAFAEQGAEPARRPAPRTSRKREAAGRAREAFELPDFARFGPVERQPLRSVRRTTARRMARAWAEIPHVTHNDMADVTELEAFRRRHAAEIEERGGRLTLTVLVMKAVVAALTEFPRFNTSLDVGNEELVYKRYHHLGIALDSKKGLLVPTIRNVDRKSLAELAVELYELAQRVRRGEARPEDMSGGTFTITNVGPMGGIWFTPIVNHPEVAILGLGRARLEPVVQGSLESPEIVPRLLLPLSLGFDHRVNDGADAARFLNKVIDVLSDVDSFALAV